MDRISASWIEAHQLRIHPSGNGADFLAVNQQLGQQARIDAGGFLVETLGTECRADGLRVLGHGREGTKLHAWSAQRREVDDAMLEYFGDGLSVQYVHDQAGLRQNFVIHERPEGCGRVQVGLAVAGDSESRLSTDDELRFIGEDGSVRLIYSGLRVWDACGKALHARITAETDRVWIAVDDRDARYPVTIDPVAAVPTLLLVNPLANGQFSLSLRTAGDLNGDGYSDVVVSAPSGSMGETNEGVVFVYYGSPSGISSAPNVTLQSNQVSSQFGYSVGTAGDVNGDGYGDLLVGASSWESAAAENQEGAVFVFHGSAAGIGTVANYILQPNATNQFMGFSVSCAGDLNNDGYSDVVIGSPYAYYPTSLEGCAWVFLGGATGLNPVFHKRLERNQGAAQFGNAVAGLGDVNGDGYSDIGVAGFRFDLNGTDDGIVCVYHGSAVGIAGGANPAPNSIINAFAHVSNMGWSLASAGDVNGDGYSDMIVGDWRGGASGAPVQAGNMLVYHGSAAGIQAAPATVLSYTQANAWFGRSVSCAGDVNGDGYADVLVGATTFTGGQASEGAGFLFLGSPAGIPTSFTTRYEYNITGANMGESVSGAGDVNGDGYSDFLIGMKLYGVSGGALMYHGGASNVSTVASVSAASGQAGARMGESVADAGDVNGDGFSDVIIGAPEASNGQAGEGLAHVHYGSAAGIGATPDLILEGNVAGARFGASVATAGDVNGDGYADVIVGAPLSGNGRAYVYHGSGGGLSTTPALVLTGSAGSELGFGACTAGDVNSDGFADVVVGAPGLATAFIHLGTASGTDPAPVATLLGPAGSRFGAAVSTAGDVNGSGYSDVIVGAPLMSNGQANEGGAFVYHGHQFGLNTTPAIQLEPNLANALFGTTVAGCGDMTGDGFYEVVVGAPAWANGQAGEGGAFIYRGTATGTTTAGMITVQPNQVNAGLGTSVDEGGDMNGDGYADVVIGAPFYSNGHAAEGRAYVIEGSPAGIGAITSVESNVPGWNLGISVAGGGDTDGDGYSDLIAGAPSAAPAFSNEGAFYLHRGNQALSLSRLTRQLATDLVSPLSTNSFDPLLPDWFGIGHRVKSPIQRTPARLRWEVVFEGQPFSGAPITNSMGFTSVSAAWTNLPLTGGEIKELVYKTPGHMRYKWRVRAEYPQNKLIDGQRFGRWHYGYASGFGDIGILPVELLSFTGRAEAGGDLLEWVTASEQGVSAFEIERSLEADRGFDAIGYVDAVGTSSAPVSYRHLHAAGSNGLRYYRLRIVDRDGSGQFSPVVAIRGGHGMSAAWPNPAIDHVDWLVPAGRWRVMDPVGRLVAEGRADETGRIRIDMASWPAGCYALQAIDADGQVHSSTSVIKR